MGPKLIFHQNLALIYANDIGSIPAKMVSINFTQYNNQLIRAGPNKNTQSDYDRKRRMLQEAVASVT